MTYIRGNTIGEAWLKYLKYILINGNIVIDDVGKIIEVPCIIIELSDKVKKSDEIIKKHGEQKILKLYKRKMTSLEIVPELNSSYGKRLYSQLGINQIEWLINKLRNKPFTKAASISLLLPNDPGPRIPCLVTLDAKIRRNKLILTGMFRSQNALNSYGNMIELLRLQEKLSKELKISKGLLRLFILSPHIYVNELNKVLRIKELAHFRRRLGGAR